MQSDSTPQDLRVPRAWSLLSRHGMVIVLLAINPHLTIREISLRLGLTDRTVYSIIRDLADAGMVRVNRVGRNNVYSVDADARLVNPMFRHVPLGKFLALLKPAGRRRKSRATPAPGARQPA